MSNYYHNRHTVNQLGELAVGFRFVCGMLIFRRERIKNTLFYVVEVLSLVRVLFNFHVVVVIVKTVNTKIHILNVSRKCWKRYVYMKYVYFTDTANSDFQPSYDPRHLLKLPWNFFKNNIPNEPWRAFTELFFAISVSLLFLIKGFLKKYNNDLCLLIFNTCLN